MCLLLACCISWRYKTYATATTSTTKTPPAAIKTTRTILFCIHIHPVITVFRSSMIIMFFSRPPLVQRLGSSAQPCCCDASRIGWTSFGAVKEVQCEFRKCLFGTNLKGRDLNGCVRTKTSTGILAVSLYTRYIWFIHVVSCVFLYIWWLMCVCVFVTIRYNT